MFVVRDLLIRKLQMEKTISNDLDFSEYLLHDSKVAVVPGIAFGKSPFFLEFHMQLRQRISMQHARK